MTTTLNRPKPARPAARASAPAPLTFRQRLARLDRTAEAIDVLKQGIVAAGSSGDDHARSEMEGLLASLE